MKTKAEDFVVPVYRGSYSYVSGLTKREFFAAMAMQGLLSHNPNMTLHSVSSIATSIADALIAKLNDQSSQTEVQMKIDGSKLEGILKRESSKK